MNLSLVIDHNGYGVRVTIGERDGKHTWLVQWKTKDPVIGWVATYPKMAWRAVSEAYYASHNVCERANATPVPPRRSEKN